MGGDRRGEVDGEASVGPILYDAGCKYSPHPEPGRHRRKHHHHSEGFCPGELHPEVVGKAEMRECRRHLRQAQLRVGGEAHLQAEEGAEKLDFGVILSEAKNLFGIQVQTT